MTWPEKLLARLRSVDPGIDAIWIADTEFYGADGDVPTPVCAVFHNPITSQTVRQFYGPSAPYPSCPVPLDERTVFVAYAAQAELMTFLQLGWEMPRRILDLLIEWRLQNNEEHRLQEMKRERGEYSPLSLLGVCAKHGIHVQSHEHKEEMRALILRGHPYTSDEQQAILDYCEEDVRETTELLGKMEPNIEEVRAAVFRGASARGFAWARTTGIPMDVETLAGLNRHWDRIMAAIAGAVQDRFPVFKPNSADISASLWREFLDKSGLLDDWPMSRGGKTAEPQPRRDLDTLKAMQKKYPYFKALIDYLSMRSCTKLGLEFPVGRDGRSRVHFWDFGTVTGRCSPSSSKFVISGGSPAFRHLVKPNKGEVLIELDWSAQEIWIAAYLSGDPAMQRMLASGDPYVAFGAMAKILPADATKKPDKSPYYAKDPMLAEQHTVIRNRLKAVALGVLYGKTAYTIADEEDMSLSEAKHLLRLHRRLFPRFWVWLTGEVVEAMATRRISTKFGWTRWIATRKEREAHLQANGRPKQLRNSLQNYHMQAHGAEMLRLALTHAADARLPVCAPLHDAIFAVAPAHQEQEVITGLLACMEQASREVIGVRIPVEESVVRYPDRFVPSKKPEAIKTWEVMMKALSDAEATVTQVAVQAVP